MGVVRGLSVPQYLPGVELTGIDATVEMLAKARYKVTQRLWPGRSAGIPILIVSAF